MKKIRKITCLTLVLLVVLSSNAYAKSDNNDSVKKTKVVYQTVVSEEVLEANFEQQLQQIIQEHSRNTRGYGDKYETEIVHTTIATINGYLQGNSPGGTHFPTGGGFTYCKTGGTSLSVSVQLPAPFNVVYVGGSLGQVGVSGYYISVPNKNDFFKLYGSKDYKVKAYKLWKVDPFTGERTLEQTGTLTEFWRDSYWCVSQ